jgi:hypothetical protein
MSESTPVAPVEVARPNTDPYAPGNKTSEYRVAALIAVFGGLLGGIESAMALLKDAYPSSWWVPLAVGLVTMLGAAFSYVKSRSTIKTAILNTEAAVQVSRNSPSVTTTTTLP